MLTVTEITQNIKKLLESNFKSLEIVGEISTDFKPHYSGHYYFSIKDSGAVLDAIIWKSAAIRMNTNFKRGDKVILKGRLALYEKWGKYQIIVSSIQKEGKGNLFLAFEQLKEKLEREGLFSQEKKALPFLPKKLALLTAQDGAALTDFLKIAEKRYPFLQVVVVPTAVQGERAAPDIVRSILYASQTLKDVDLIVLTRGGGSIEDLWAFNEEIVARAIANCKIPLVSAIGHERDFTIADFVADKRAATPSEAAELVYPEYAILMRNLKMIQAKMEATVRNTLLNKEMQLMRGKQYIKNKSLRLSERKEEIEDYKAKLIDDINLNMNSKWDAIQDYKNRLQQQDPLKKLLENKNDINLLKNKLQHLIERKISHKKQEISFIQSKLTLISPYNLLEKGYALIKDEQNQAISSVEQLKKGDKIQILLKDGRKQAEIEE